MSIDTAPDTGWSVTPKEKLHVDHDHKTGIVRGLLCGNCNRALGLIKDKLETLTKLYQYLEKSNAS